MRLTRQSSPKPARQINVNFPKARALSVAAITTGLVLTPLATPAFGLGNEQAVAPKLKCGSVLLPGSAWLGGLGVDVHYSPTSPHSCGGYSRKNMAVQAGGAWQCVEVATRLYYVRKWGAVWTGGNGGAQYIPEGSPNLQFVRNGSGLLPIPGDLIIEAFGTYGHVTVVDSVVGNTINAVEENAARSARHTYTLEGSAISGAYGGGIVRGFMHSKKNTLGTMQSAPTASLPSITTVGPNPTPLDAGTNGVGAVTPGTAGVRWAAAQSPGAHVTGYEVSKRRVNLATGKLSPWTYYWVSSSSRSFTTKVIAGRTFRLRVRASNALGWGTWTPRIQVQS